MSYEVEFLSDDVIIEILSWLTPETLLKFKSVCKLWYSTINDAKFIVKHQSHFGNSLHDDNGRILMAEEKYTRSFLCLNLLLVEESNPDIVHTNMELTIPNPYFFSMMGSCNGMFCYASFLGNDAPIQLCNPSTRWARLVPSYRLSNLATPHRYGYGVGFDQSANDYKVLKFDSRLRESTIYSVKTKSWKTINTTAPSNITYYNSLSVFLRGFIHWLAYTVQSRKGKLMLFDVRNEVFGEMQLPEIDKSLEKNIMSIYVVKGLLCLLVEENIGFSKIICHIWTMKEYGVAESWIKQHTLIAIERVYLRSIQLTVGGKIMISRNDGSDTQKLNLYNPETGELCRYVGRTGDRWSLCSLVANL